MLDRDLPNNDFRSPGIVLPHVHWGNDQRECVQQTSVTNRGIYSPKSNDHWRLSSLTKKSLFWHPCKDFKSWHQHIFNSCRDLTDYLLWQEKWSPICTNMIQLINLSIKLERRWKLTELYFQFVLQCTKVKF